MADSVRGKILWYELLTTDMKAAEAFYTPVVGWTVKAFEGAPQPYDTFMRKADTAAAGIMTIPEGMQFPPHWEMYVGVESVDDAVAEIERRGGRALGPLVEVPTIGRMRTMTDPQGAVFAIYQPEQPQPSEAPREVGEASWHELMTTDDKAAVTFYSDVFGWQQSQAFDMGPMGTYYIFKRSFDLGGIMNKPKELTQVPPSWGIYFRVPDVDAAAERVKANGGKVLNGPMDVPGGDRVVNCMDPQGAAFSLHARKG